MAVFDFNRAIVRLPAESVVNGLRAGDQESPSFEGVRREHAVLVAGKNRRQNAPGCRAHERPRRGHHGHRQPG